MGYVSFREGTFLKHPNKKNENDIHMLLLGQNPKRLGGFFSISLLDGVAFVVVFLFFGPGSMGVVTWMQPKWDS